MDNPIGKPCIMYSVKSKKKFGQSPFKFGFSGVDLSSAVVAHCFGSSLNVDMIRVFLETTEHRTGVSRTSKKNNRHLVLTNDSCVAKFFCTYVSFEKVCRKR